MKTTEHFGLRQQICILRLKPFNLHYLGYLYRFILPVSQDGWGISWIHVEISFCRPKKNSKTLKLEMHSMESVECIFAVSFHGYCPDIKTIAHDLQRFDK